MKDSGRYHEIRWNVEIAGLAEAFRGQAAVGTLDVEAEPETPKRYGIQTIPAVLFFKDGEVVNELTSVVDKTDIAAKLHALTGTSQARPLESTKHIEEESEAR